MAGAGYKLFNTGDVLTAAQVNTYLQEQAVMRFATTTARTTALSGVLAEGMVTYIDATDSLEFYNGSAWVAVNTTAGDITGITTGATSGLTGGVTSGTADLKLNTTAKGGLLVGTGSGTVTELAVGSNNTVLTADSSTASGLKWATAASANTFAGCSVWNSANQSLSNNTYTALTFNSEDYDTDAFHSTSSNTSRITIPSGKAGYYLITATALFDVSSTGSRTLTIKKNGTTDLLYTLMPSQATDETSTAITLLTNAAVGDYYEVFARQKSGGNLNVLGGASGSYTKFQMNLIGV